MTKEEAIRHEKEVLVGKKSAEDIYDEDVLQRGSQRRKETEFCEKFR